MLVENFKLDFRDKQILAGLFLSKFDLEGLNILGFSSFTEAFNCLGYALGGRPASIKNYRDEFDPLFPNPRQGWKNRHRRMHCMELEEKFRGLSISDFAQLISNFCGASWIQEKEKADMDIAETDQTSFAKRLVTGVSAEKYFEAKWKEIPDFSDCTIENTTAHGCGFDFKVWPKSGIEFQAVEVKGMAGSRGAISLTEKEHKTSVELQDRFFLFIVINFQESPFHEIYRNPLSCNLNFTRKERVVVQVSWTAFA
jgi:hypothetical protein